MSKQSKTFDFEVSDKKASGGTIVINTAALDRDNDRVVPAGVKIENYLKNPTVQWGHNLRDPWAVIGKTDNIQMTDKGLTAEFTLREPASPTDPQHIVKYLWENELLKTSSVGFRALGGEKNNEGGTDITEWELLEWSLVPVPANQEALMVSMKSLFEDGKQDKQIDNTKSKQSKQEVNSEIDEKLFTQYKGLMKQYRKFMAQMRETLGISKSENEEEQLVTVFSRAHNIIQAVKDGKPNRVDKETPNRKKLETQSSLLIEKQIAHSVAVKLTQELQKRNNNAGDKYSY